MKQNKSKSPKFLETVKDLKEYLKGFPDNMMINDTNIEEKLPKPWEFECTFRMMLPTSDATEASEMAYKRLKTALGQNIELDYNDISNGMLVGE